MLNDRRVISERKSPANIYGPVVYGASFRKEGELGSIPNLVHQNELRGVVRARYGRNKSTASSYCVGTKHKLDMS